MNGRFTVSRILAAVVASGLTAFALCTSGVGVGMAHAARSQAAPWLTVNARARMVHLRLIAGWHGVNGGLNFNGYSNGQMVVTVPLGWKVQVTFSNQRDAPHSAEVIAFQNPVPEIGFKVAFKNAQSPHPLDGITLGDRPQTFTFVAGKVGQYMIVCGVPGHANGGMWDTFVVARTARTATLAIKKG